MRHIPKLAAIVGTVSIGLFGFQGVAGAWGSGYPGQTSPPPPTKCFSPPKGHHHHHYPYPVVWVQPLSSTHPGLTIWIQPQPPAGTPLPKGTITALWHQGAPKNWPVGCAYPVVWHHAVPVVWLHWLHHSGRSFQLTSSFHHKR